jgi:hypothetical protein
MHLASKSRNKDCGNVFVFVWRQDFLFVYLYNSIFPLSEDCSVALAVEIRYEGAFCLELCIKANLGIGIRFQGDISRSKHGEGQERNKNPYFSEQTWRM